MRAALLDMGPGQAHHQRHPHLDLLQGLHDALGDPVAAVDAGEDVHQHRLHLGVGEHQIEGLGHPLRRGPAADVEEVGRLAAGMLDHVHGRHGEPGAVDDAADIAVEPDIAEAAVRRLGLAGILLRLVAQLGDAGPAEERVVVEAHLGVERQQHALGRGHQRVDLHHGGVEIAEGPVAAEDGLHRLRRMAGVEAEAEGDLAGLEGLHADGGIDADADQGLGPGGADLLDLHAARRRGHHHDALALAVEDQAEIELAAPHRVAAST